MTPCECKNDNFICHAAKGCVCRHGFGGVNCDEPLVLGRIVTTPNEGLGYGGVVAGISIALILVSIIVLVILYYKRRVENLKTEIAHVQYIADPPERNNFDNPVYTYQGGGKRDNEHLLNNTNCMIRNNLNRPSNTLLERARLAQMGAASCSSTVAYNVEDELRSLKNKDADATNPNIYHSLDKLDDHVYDEIKQKDMKDIELEYDHLDYTRPVSTIKPHYQKMPSPFGSKDPIKEEEKPETDSV